LWFNYEQGGPTRPSRLGGTPYTLADTRKHLLADLRASISFWSAYPNIWMGRLRLNTIAPARKRNGGWGFLSGLRFQPAPGQARAVTTMRGATRYTGFQLTDPWMIASDARQHQCCLNISQATPGTDGAFTHIISTTDPGVTNWLDTFGIHDGFGILRWQDVPSDMAADGLIRDLRLLSLADVAALPAVTRVTPTQRQQQRVARVTGNNDRTE
jgi:hypothetical protein